MIAILNKPQKPRIILLDGDWVVYPRSGDPYRYVLFGRFCDACEFAATFLTNSVKK